MQATDEVTDEMLKETTEAELFPQASQYADEDVDDIWPCDEDMTESTGEETSQESGAPEELTQQAFELSPHELDYHNDAPKSY